MDKERDLLFTRSCSFREMEFDWIADVSVIYGVQLDIPDYAYMFLFLHALISFEPMERESLFCRASKALPSEVFDSLDDFLHEKIAKRVHQAGRETIVSIEDANNPEYISLALSDDEFMSWFQFESRKLGFQDSEDAGPYHPEDFVWSMMLSEMLGDCDIFQQFFLRAVNGILRDNHGLHLIYRRETHGKEWDPEAKEDAWLICHKESTIQPRSKYDCAGYRFGSTNVPWGVQVSSIPNVDPNVEANITIALEALQLMSISGVPGWMLLTIASGGKYIIFYNIKLKR